jgi:hypothetical protein
MEGIIAFWGRALLFLKEKEKKNSVVLVRKRTIPTKRPQPADEVSALLYT